jgi:hypothetical protein
MKTIIRFLERRSRALHWMGCALGAMVTTQFAAVSHSAIAASIVAVAPPKAYEPFDIDVRCNNSYCLSSTYPLLGDVAYKERRFTITLTHLKSGTCEVVRRLRIPGLPAGSQTLVVQMTGGGAPTNGYIGFSPGADLLTLVTETVQTSIDVAENGFVKRVLFTYRDDGPRLAVPIPASDVGKGPVVLGNGQLANVAKGIGGDWLEIEGGYTFSVLSPVPGAVVPNQLSALRLLSYPEPYKGIFATIDSSTADRLTAEWANTPPYGSTVAYGLVGKLVDGDCPIGMSPVYQAFHRTAIAHRYTQSASTYRMLLANGYVGDGAVSCAPEQQR